MNKKKERCEHLSFLFHSFFFSFNSLWYVNGSMNERKKSRKNDKIKKINKEGKKDWKKNERETNEWMTKWKSEKRKKNIEKNWKGKIERNICK